MGLPVRHVTAIGGAVDVLPYEGRVPVGAGAKLRRLEETEGNLRLRARLPVHQRVANDELILLGQDRGRIPGNPALPLPALVSSALTDLSVLGLGVFDEVCRDAPGEPGTFQRGSMLLRRCFYHTLAGLAYTTHPAHTS